MATTSLTPENLRARFAELTSARDQLTATSGPLREQRDAITAKYRDDVGAVESRIRVIEVGLFELDQERALIARALGGRTSLE